MTVSQVIRELEAMPQDASVLVQPAGKPGGLVASWDGTESASQREDVVILMFPAWRQLVC